MSILNLAAGATIAAFAFPLVLAVVMAVRALRPLAVACAPWAALPAFLLAIGLYGRATVDWSFALLGVQLGSRCAVTPCFLVFSSAIWLGSGLFGRAYLQEDGDRHRFWSYFLLTMSGNLGLVLARDVVSFYCFFALMTFAAYGLITHERSEATRRAGRVYLIMALVGETLLLAALVTIVGARVNVGLQDAARLVALSPHRDLLVALLFVGFGIKTGVLLLHMWLPLAHPAAPTPASAVLSGSMIKAGVLGWLQLLPLGLVEMPTAGLSCTLAGLAAGFYGIAIGLVQRDPKTILAYSSISQMGFLTAALGVGLSSPELASSAIAAILFYAMHHAFAKGALFLGVGVARSTGTGWSRRLLLVGLLWPALDLAGAPLSSGALAKISLKNVLVEASFGGVLASLLSLAAIGSTLLMVHFLHRTIPRRTTDARSASPGLWLPWALLVVIDLGLLVRPGVETDELRIVMQVDKLWAASWPVLVGVALGLAALSAPRLRAATVDLVPPGDLVVLFERAADRLARTVRAWRRAIDRPWHRLTTEAHSRTRQLWARPFRLLELAESRLASSAAIGLLLLLLLILVLNAQALLAALG